MENGDYEVAVAFSDPYGVYLPQEIIADLEIDSGDPVKLVFDVDGEETEIVAKTQEQDVMQEDNEVHPFLEQEVHALFYGMASIIDDLPSGFEDSFSRFQGDQPNEIEIDELEDLAAYLEELKTNIFRFTQNHVIVGCGFFELFLKDSRDVDQLIQTPLFQIDQPTFKELLESPTPPLIEIIPYEGDISNPEVVYFCTEYFAASEQQQERIRDIITGYELFMKNGDYVIPQHYIAAHGPLPTENLEGEPNIVRVTPDSIEFTAAQVGSILPIDEATKFDFDQINSILTDLFNQEEFEVGKSWEDNQITLSIADVRLTFYVLDDEIRYSYFHATDPDTIEAIEGVLDALPGLFLDELDIEAVKSPTNTNKLVDNVDRNTWVLDTNALYHQIPGRGASSIMHLFLPNMNLYGKKVTIPWQVLVEINRHKGGKKSSQTASEQGVENLQILHLLDNYGFIDLDIRPVPDELDSSIFPETGATDLAILSTVNAAEDGILLTRDERLIDFCTIMDTPVEHVEFLTTLQPEMGEQNLFGQVEQELREPQKRDALIDFISERVEMREKEWRYATRGEDAQSMLQTWIDERKIITYNSDHTQHVALARPVDIVPSYEFLQKIPEYIDSEHHLEESLLKMMREELQAQPGNYPWVDIHVPEEYVYHAMCEDSQNHENDLLNTLYRIEHLKNADYTSIPLVFEETRDSDLDKVAVRAAKDVECHLVCLENEDLQRLARLLDVSIASIRLEE